jgi:hypothetical protein
VSERKERGRGWMDRLLAIGPQVCDKTIGLDGLGQSHSASIADLIGR